MKNLLALLTMTLCCLQYPQLLQAQQRKPDSVLVQECMAMPDGKAKADSLFKLSTKLRSRIDIEPMLKEVQRIVRKVGYIEKEVMVLDFYGVYMRDHSRYAEAIDLHNQALAMAKEQSNVKSQIIALNNLGVVYRRLDECASALKYLFEALKLSEQSHDIYSVSVALNSIGNVHLALANYNEAIIYFKRCLPIAEEAKNNLGTAMNLKNIGEAYESLNMLDSAAYYYEQSLRYNQKIKARKGEAICFNSLGNVLLKKGEIDKAVALLEQALDISKQQKDEIYISGNFIDLGLAYTEKGYFAKAEQHFQEGLKIALSIGSKTEVKEAYKGLMELHEKMKNFTQALEYGRKYKVYADSIVNEKNSRAMAQLETVYATEKKEMKIAALEKEKQFYLWLGIAGGALLLLTLAFFMVRQRLAVNKRKLAEQQVKQLEQEKQLVATQAILEGETAERTRLARDLHDGLGGMLSAVKLNIPEMKSGSTLDAEDVEQFNKAMGMLDESIGELRRVAHHMMPDSLVRYGLKPSISAFCDEFPTVHFHYFGQDERIDSRLEVVMYRVVHELVNNALKHAAASQINVQLVFETDRISLTVQDNGKGFDTSVVTKGIGLENIRNRVDSFNGKFFLYSSEEKGTEASVEFQLPISVNNNTQEL